MKNIIEYIKEHENQILSDLNHLIDVGILNPKLIPEKWTHLIISVKEIEKIGFFEEIENKIVLIEWPEKIEKILKKRKDISFIKKNK